MFGPSNVLCMSQQQGDREPPRISRDGAVWCRMDSCCRCSTTRWLLPRKHLSAIVGQRFPSSCFVHVRASWRRREPLLRRCQTIREMALERRTLTHVKTKHSTLCLLLRPAVLVLSERRTVPVQDFGSACGGARSCLCRCPTLRLPWNLRGKAFSRVSSHFLWCAVSVEYSRFFCACHLMFEVLGSRCRVRCRPVRRDCLVCVP